MGSGDSRFAVTSSSDAKGSSAPLFFLSFGFVLEEPEVVAGFVGASSVVAGLPASAALEAFNSVKYASLNS